MSSREKRRILQKLANGDLAAELEEKLGYGFVNRKYLTHALTHASYVHQRRGKGLADNERLEFFGDAVLGFAISEKLLGQFPRSGEGDLSRMRASLVESGTLARIAREIGLGKYVLLGYGEVKNGGRDKRSVLANVLEALAAAIYLDGGVGAVNAFVERFFGDEIRASGSEEEGNDYKTTLQELAHSIGDKPPVYVVDDVSGPDHDLKFEVTVIMGRECFARGTGKTRKEAEQAAAREGLLLLREELDRAGRERENT